MQPDTKQESESPAAPAADPNRVADYALGIAGALAGAVLGYFAFRWILSQGLYAIVVPGALIGLGCGALSGRWSRELGMFCAVFSLLAGIYAEWSCFPFRTDGSLLYFITHVHQVKPISLIMIALGVWMGYSFGCGRPGGSGFRKRRPGNSG